MAVLATAFAGCGEEDAPTDGGVNDQGGSDVGNTPSDLSVTGAGNTDVSNGGSYMQATLDGIPPYSDGVAALTITNQTSAALTVHSITLTPVGETEAIEWALNDPGTTSRVPLTVSEEVIAPNGGFSFGLFFYPLASGARNVEVSISYGASQTFSFTVVGRGRDNATISPVVSNGFERVFARSNLANSNSFQSGGLAADGSGNIFLNGNVSGWDDRFNDNLVMARVNANGTLAWVRELQEDFDQEARDIGDNAEVGGGQDSIAYGADGQLYIVAQRTQSATASFQAFVMQVDPATGAFGWARGLTTGPEAPTLANQVMRGQSIDVSLSGRVLVAGQIADSAGAFLAALSTTDGSLIWAQQFAISGVHRVGSLAVDVTNGRAYLGGIAGNAPFIARVDGVDGATPSMSWSRQYSPSFASIHGMALDGATGLLVSLDKRGASTDFVGARISTADGAVVWAKVWDDSNSGDNNNTLTVAMHGGDAIFGGRVAITPFDTQGGEGFLLSLDPSDGSYNWGSFYYTGKGAQELITDHITGMVSTTDGLWVLHQQTPGSNNMHHYWGRWYEAIDDTLDFPGGDGSMRLADYALTAGTAGAAPLSALGATAHTASVTGTDWVDVTSVVEFEDPVVTESEGFRAGTHSLLQRLVIQ